MRLGVAGDYAGAVIGPFSGNIAIIGDPANLTAYRILPVVYSNEVISLLLFGITSMHISGVSIVMNVASSFRVTGIRADSSQLIAQSCQIAMEVAAYPSIMLWIVNGGFFTTAFGTMSFIGGSNHLSSVVQVERHSTTTGANLDAGETSNYYFTNITADVFLLCESLSVQQWDSATALNNTGCFGQQYSVVENSIISMGGRTPPGTVAGATGSGGVFEP
jgi:hypothetical protein